MSDIVPFSVIKHKSRVGLNHYEYALIGPDGKIWARSWSPGPSLAREAERLNRAYQMGMEARAEKEQGELPTLHDLQALGPWDTGGKSAVQFVRDLRDGRD